MENIQWNVCNPISVKSVSCWCNNCYGCIQQIGLVVSMLIYKDNNYY